MKMCSYSVCVCMCVCVCIYIDIYMAHGSESMGSQTPGSLVGCRLWGHIELDTNEAT